MLDTTTRSTTMSASIGDRNTVVNEETQMHPDYSIATASELFLRSCVPGVVIGVCGGFSVAGVRLG